MTDEDRSGAMAWAGCGAILGWALVWLISPWIPQDDHRPAAAIVLGCVMAALIFWGLMPKRPSPPPAV